MESAFLFVTAAGQGACLAVLASSDADLGLIAYEMAMLVTRVGEFMAAPDRPVARLRCRLSRRAPGTTGSTPTPGPVVRPYALTQGRVAPVRRPSSTWSRSSSRPMPDAPPPPSLQPEHHAIISASWEPMSVVELASKLDLSIGVVRVLLGDLRSAGLISLYEPPEASQRHDIDVLKAVVNGLRAL